VTVGFGELEGIDAILGIELSMRRVDRQSDRLA
jgi:hypothetical protein